MHSLGKKGGGGGGGQRELWELSSGAVAGRHRALERREQANMGWGGRAREVWSGLDANR